MRFAFPALIRLAPTAQPLAQAWTFYATAQAADVIVDASPGWSLPSVVTWAAAHMLLAAMTSRFLGAAAASDDSTRFSHQQRLKLAVTALVIALLLGLVVVQQPTILLPALGLALAVRGSSAPARQEERP